MGERIAEPIMKMGLFVIPSYSSAYSALSAMLISAYNFTAPMDILFIGAFYVQEGKT
ncbi:hypothetical protein [Salinicoccus luteus]|uniref:hypothetical protein n=1 Tax=Salinicoccus luteus TaxID=367840 RepID=UPI0012EB9AA9|nr:hypothetical protein [Salinicoccus luteus]